jgi:hypothetical protein
VLTCSLRCAFYIDSSCEKLKNRLFTYSSPAKGDVGLGNVDNTSDANKDLPGTQGREWSPEQLQKFCKGAWE